MIIANHSLVAPTSSAWPSLLFIMKKKKTTLGKLITVNGVRYQYQGTNGAGSYAFRNFESAELNIVKGDDAQIYLEKL